MPEARPFGGDEAEPIVNAPAEPVRVCPKGSCRALSTRGISDFVPQGLDEGSQAIYCLEQVQTRINPVRCCEAYPEGITGLGLGF